MFIKLLILITLMFAVRDWYIIEVKKRSPNHGKGFTMRLVISSIVCLVVAKNNLDIIENFIAAPFIVWFVFQYGLNVLRGKPLTYLSPTSNNTDRILLKVFKNPKMVFVVLVVLFVSSIIFKIYGL